MPTPVHGGRAGSRSAVERPGLARRPRCRRRCPRTARTASVSTTPRPVSSPTGSPRSVRPGRRRGGVVRLRHRHRPDAGLTGGRRWSRSLASTATASTPSAPRGEKRLRAGCSSSTRPTTMEPSRLRGSGAAARAGRRGRGPDRRRREAAERLAVAVTEELGLLAMPDASMGIRVGERETPAPPDAADLDALLVSNFGSGSTAAGSTRSSCSSPPTPDPEPRPLHKGASGGELSRVMLAVEVRLADTHSGADVRLRRGGCRRRGSRGRRDRHRLAARPGPGRDAPGGGVRRPGHVVVEKSWEPVAKLRLTTLDNAGPRAELSRMPRGWPDPTRPSPTRGASRDGTF